MAATFHKMTGFARTHGQMYEVKIASLLFLRGLSSGRPFQLASNVAGAGAFDDVVFKYDSHTAFFQLKHRESDKAVIYADTLLGPKNDFSLMKYLDSFITIRLHVAPGNENQMFDGVVDGFDVVLYTNAELCKQLQDRDRKRPLPDHVNILKSGTDKESIVRFSEDSDPDIYEALNRDGDDTKCFLERLFIFSSEPRETELDDIIKDEMIMVCTTMSKSVIDLIYPRYLDNFQRWWSDSNTILDQDSDLLSRSIHQHIVDNLVAQQEKLLTLDVRFQETFTNQLRDDFLRNDRVLHLALDTSSIELLSTKLLQVLWNQKESFIFLGKGCLVQENEAVMSAWKNGDKNILVVVDDFLSLEVKQVNVTRDKLLDILHCHANKRVILISCADDLGLKEKLGERFRRITNLCNLLQLEEDSLQKLMQTKMGFQGNTVQIQQLVKDVPYSEMIELQNNLVRTIMSGTQAHVIGQELAADISFFIRRTLLRYNFVKRDIFKSREFSGKLVITGVSMVELQKMLPYDQEEFNKMVSLVDDYGSDYCQYLVLESMEPEKEFDNMKSTVMDIHWVHSDEGNFVWMKSKGKISEIKIFLDEERYSKYEPEKSFDLSDRVVLLIAEPGMGKSTQLTRVANKLKEDDESLWIVRVDLNDHTALLNGTTLDDFRAVDFLAKALDMSSLEDTLFRYCLLHRDNVVVLLDGFDEISPRYTEEGKCLIASLLETNVKKIWIASRFSMKEQLEIPLSTISVTLQRFTEEDQRNFFLKYWANVKTPLTYQELKNFIIRLLDMTAQSMNDKEKQFTGIPLQSQMIAEVFEDHVVNPTIHKLPETLDLLTLYEKFVDKKFDIYITFKRMLRKHGADDDDLLDMLRAKFDKNHTYAALILLMSEKELEELDMSHAPNKAEKFLNGIKSGREKTGIVDRVICEKPNFTHQTFAEYFVAVWFSQNFRKNKDFLEKHIFQVNYKVIRNVFERILARDCRLHTAVLNGDASEVEALLLSEGVDVDGRDGGRRTALHLATTVGFENAAESCRNLRIVDALLAHGADVAIRDTDIMRWTPLRCADETRSWDIVDRLLRHNKCNTDDLVETKTNVHDQQMLQDITKYGFVDLMSFLLSKGLPVDTVVDENFQSTLLHKSSEQGQAKLVQLLIDRGGDLEMCNKDGSTPLHLASYHGKREVTETILGSLSHDREALAKHLDLRNSKSETAIHVASRQGHTNVVEVLLRQGADIASRNNQNRTPLHQAVMGGTIPVASLLLDSFQDDQILMLEYLEMRSDMGSKAIHLAVQEASEDMIVFLIGRGADVRALDDKKSTPLHLCAGHNDVAIARLLLDCFQDDRVASVDYVNAADKSGWTPLHYSARGGHRDMVELFLEEGGDMTLRSVHGHSPLHLSTNFGHLSASRLIVESLGGDREKVLECLTASDAQGLTPISICRSKKKEEMIEWLNNVLKENDISL